MEPTVIEIHPYDLAELLQNVRPSVEDMQANQQLDRRHMIQLDGKTYHQNADQPRSTGPHTIF